MKANFGLSGRCSSSPCPQRGWGLCCADSIFGELLWIFWNWKMGLRKKCPQKWRGYCPTFKVVVQPQVFCLRLDFTRNHTGKRHPCLTYVYIYICTHSIFMYLSLCVCIYDLHIFFSPCWQRISNHHTYTIQLPLQTWFVGRWRPLPWKSYVARCAWGGPCQKQ